MNDEDKTKEQLIQELARLRQRIAKLECQETECKQAERKYATIIETTSDGFWITDLKGRFIDVNDSYCRITGYTREELLAKSIADVEAIEKSEETAQHVKRVVEQGYSHFETRHRRKDGTMADIEISVAYFDVDRGQLVVFIRDITERKRVEEALRESEEQYRQLIELSPDAIAIHSLGKIAYINSAGVKLLAAENAKQLIGKSIFDFLHPCYQDTVKERIAKTSQELTTAPLTEEKFIRLDGTTVDVEVTAIPTNYRGKPAIQAVVREITKRKQAEEALKNSERKYRELADSLPQTVFELDKSGNFTFANRHGFQSSGYTSEDIEKGFNALQLFIPEDRDKVKKNILMVLGGRKSKANEYTALRKDGSTFPVIVYSAPVIYEGKPAGLRGVVLDITERKRMENTLQKSHEQLRSLTAHLQSVREEERTDIARGIHDELGQVLTALKMDLSWLSKRLPMEQELLLEKTKVMSGLINSAIQTVKKISTELRPGILDDFGLIAAIEWQAEEFHKRSGIKCTVSSVNEPYLDREHSTALFRIFQETLTNIARHTNATRVTVNLKVQGGKMIMRIRDNGKGITQEEISSSSSFGIIGMRERARALRGDISIRGIPGKSTTVTVTIPLVKNGEAQ